MTGNNWEKLPLGDLLSLEYGDSLPETVRSGSGFPVYGSNGIVGLHYKYLINTEGIIIGRKGTVGAVQYSSEPFWAIDTTYYVSLKRNDHLRWMYWLLTYLPLNRLDSSTGVPGLNRNDVYSIKCAVPPPDEQRAIADILDTIDAAIQNAERVIAKQKAVRAGLLHDLLTYGLDANGQPCYERPLTTNLYGTVPADWELQNLGNIAEIGSGVTLGRNLDGQVTVELPYLRVWNVQDGYVDLSDVKTVRVRPDEIARFRLQAGDVLMTEGGDFDKLGRGTVWRGEIEPCLHQNHIFRVRANQDYLLPDFLALVSASPYGQRFFLLGSKQSTNLASINATQLNSFPIPLPNPTEQQAIVDTVVVHDNVIQSEEAHRNKLIAKKKGLMDDLLTGRVRVGAVRLDEVMEE